MFSEADDALLVIEKRMIEAMDQEWDRWQDATNQPLPQPLVALMKDAHKMIYARLSKRGGFNMAEMMKNPQAALVHLARMTEMVRKMIDQQDKLNGAAVAQREVS